MGADESLLRIGRRARRTLRHTGRRDFLRAMVAALRNLAQQFRRKQDRTREQQPHPALEDRRTFQRGRPVQPYARLRQAFGIHLPAVARLQGLRHRRNRPERQLPHPPQPAGKLSGKGVGRLPSRTRAPRPARHARHGGLLGDDDRRRIPRRGHVERPHGLHLFRTTIRRGAPRGHQDLRARAERLRRSVVEPGPDAFHRPRGPRGQILDARTRQTHGGLLLPDSGLRSEKSPAGKLGADRPADADGRIRQHGGIPVRLRIRQPALRLRHRQPLPQRHGDIQDRARLQQGPRDLLQHERLQPGSEMEDDAQRQRRRQRPHQHGGHRREIL